MVLLLLEAFNRKRPGDRLVLVLLGELVDIRTVPVSPLPMGSGCRTDCSIGGPFRGGVLAILLSAQSAKSGLFFIITRARWRKVIRRQLPKSEVERRTRAEVMSGCNRAVERSTLVRDYRNSPNCLDCTWRRDILHITEQRSQLWEPLRFLRFRVRRFS